MSAMRLPSSSELADSHCIVPEDGGGTSKLKELPIEPGTMPSQSEEVTVPPSVPPPEPPPPELPPPPEPRPPPLMRNGNSHQQPPRPLPPRRPEPLEIMEPKTLRTMKRIMKKAKGLIGKPRPREVFAIARAGG